MRRVTAMLLASSVIVAACGDAPEFVDADEAVAGEASANGGRDRFGMTTRGGEVRLGLTDEVVYFRLSDELLEQIDRKISEELPEEEGVGGTIANAVRSGIASALRHRMQYDIDDIRAVRYDDGRLIFEFEDPGRKLPDLEVDDEPLMESFSESDAERFVREFREAKRSR